MAEIIASTYEVIGKIGSGGGGEVFLANHLRLGKKVVLKADKRKMTTRPDLLRREVDILKNLSHPYIPQVYDFFIEGETVYTVMDYIEGESLDKPLKRGESFSQPQVIQWAVELLEALHYLHSPIHGEPPKGFVHSDIKPANIMRTPRNDISLIDFNIALALGEENVVGCTAGYASPEHYGLDFSTRSGTASLDETTETAEGKTATVTLVSAGTGSTGTSSKKRILPDVRSDIYSVGATLYHLLSGKRPAKDATEVVPLSDHEFSPQIVDIISKAMNPNPDLRYQTAEEMLDAFLQLRQNDPRSKRLKKSQILVACFVSVLFLVGAVGIFVGLRRMQLTESWLKLAEYSQNALKAGDTSLAIEDALKAIPKRTGIFTPPAIASAQKALTEALAVYDLSDGYKAFGTIDLPAEPFLVAVSPEGTSIMCIYGSSLAVYDALTLERTTVLSTVNSALAEAEYLSDSLIVFAGAEGITVYDLQQEKVIWTGDPATAISVSADGKKIAAVYKDDTFARVYDSVNGQIVSTVDFETARQSVTVNDHALNPQDNLLALNDDGTKLAVSFDNGRLIIYDLQNPDNGIIVYEESSFTHFEGGFSERYFAFSATENNQSVFVIIDVSEMQQTGGFSSTMPIHVQADKNGIYISEECTLVQINPMSGDQQEVAYTDADIVTFRKNGNYTLVSTEDNSFSFFGTKAALLGKNEEKVAGIYVDLSGPVAVVGSPDSPTVRILRQEDHSEAQVFTYDADYLHNEARWSADKKTIMFFRYDRFSVFDMAGNLLANVRIPDADQVYDQQYRRSGDESWLDVIYNSGLVRSYSAADGTFLSERQSAMPDDMLKEEFLTDNLRIVAPYHETAVVYERDSGKLVTTLEPDANLTYVTQVNGFIVTEYITAQKERYGLLLNEKCEELARLPNLCDVLEDGTLLFDDMLGNLRQSRIYNIEEIIALAETRREH